MKYMWGYGNELKVRAKNKNTLEEPVLLISGSQQIIWEQLYSNEIHMRTWKRTEGQSKNKNTVDSRYLEFQGTLLNTSRYPYLDISELQNWGKNNSNI